MPDEETEVEEEEEEIEEEEEEEASPPNPPAAPTPPSEGDPAWLIPLNQRLDRIDADLEKLSKRHSKPRPRPVTEKHDEPPTGNRQERKRKRNQRRFLGRLAKKAD